jgi:CheY-like chemotaxis protein
VADRSTKLLMLIVDDDVLIRRMLLDLFADGPYDFVEAEDGEEALRAAKRWKPDVVITDLMLPRLSGDALIRILRKTTEFGATPVIAITAGSDEMRLQAKLAGANIVLTKPLWPQEVVRQVEELLAASPFLRK